ncbi:hypothetical protein [Halomonas caseinilytica]|uniref:hypothetical protein n=1 Tax=Halomonas caseinilytica TaxID=438744 RepID=UPI0008490D5A|nr:hypothetical protein [Halomonas caseinilytica]
MVDKHNATTSLPSPTGIRPLQEHEYVFVDGGVNDQSATLSLDELGGGWATTMAVGEEEPWHNTSVALDIELHIGASAKSE